MESYYGDDMWSKKTDEGQTYKDNLKEKDGNKYIMCAGKYDRNGWTIVFKARNYKEAEYIIENTPLKAKKGCNVELFAKPHPIYC